MNKIKVLWMNNGDNRLLSFISDNILRDFDIVTCRNIDECERRIVYSSENWDAIMLNASPRVDEEIPKVDNVFNAHLQIKKATNAPVFIVSTGGTISIWDEYAIQKIAGNKFYKLEKSSLQLFEDIKSEVELSEDYQIRKENKEVFEFYSSIDESKSDALLLRLLKNLRTNDFYKDPLIPANVRLILDKIMDYLSKIGILKENKFNGSNLNKCSLELGRMNEVVPCHVQRCIHSCVVIANNGNHQIPEESKQSYEYRINNPLFVQRQIKSCQAPYLNKALVYDLLNILIWCATFKDK